MHLINPLLLCLGTLTACITAAPQTDNPKANDRAFRNSTRGSPYPFPDRGPDRVVDVVATTSSLTPAATILANYASAPYKFNADSHRNLAVYYGKTDLSQSQNLTSQCADPNIDIVILGFVTEILGLGGYPVLALNNTLGELCEPPNASMLDKGATGLKRCEALQQGMTDCQAMGKKVFISVGGANGDLAFSGAAEAERAAQMMWDLFGGGDGESAPLRPFGSATVDGFDIGTFHLLPIPNHRQSTY